MFRREDIHVVDHGLQLSEDRLGRRLALSRGILERSQTPGRSGGDMRYQRISADCHIDLPMLDPDFFTRNASAALKDRMPFVTDSPTARTGQPTTPTR
jgi:hypothetical protein